MIWHIHKLKPRKLLAGKTGTIAVAVTLDQGERDRWLFDSGSLQCIVCGGADFLLF